MTGDLVKAMRHCPQPVIAAVEGVCAGAGAILAMASDLRYAAPSAKVAFLFVRVGLAGCDMGACAILPRIIGQGRAAELLYTGRSMSAEEGLAWGFFNRRRGSGPRSRRWRRRKSSPAGPTLAHADDQEDAAPGMERRRRRGDRDGSRRRRRCCMQTKDFHRAYEAFAAKQKPVFRGRLMDRFAHYGWPFFEPRHAAAGARGRSAGRRRTSATRTARTPTRSAGAWCRTSAAPATCTTASPRSPTCARSRCCARCSPTTPGSPISPSSCRAWAAARSRWPAATRRRSSYLPKAAAGDAIAAFALSEPDAGSDVQAMSTTARSEGRRAGCSTAPRPGSPTAASPTSTWCSPRPRRASARSSSTRRRWTPPSASTSWRRTRWRR